MNKLSIQVAEALVEECSQVLEEAGALAVSVEAASAEALLEPPLTEMPLWSLNILHAFFEEEVDLTEVCLRLTGVISPASFHPVIESIQSIDWQTKFRESVPARCFGGKLWVYPTWYCVSDETQREAPSLPFILLDPGLAFGTGAHETTQLCLTWLADHIVGGEHVVDYGCGSGILALAALRLGARTVWAVDHDVQALEATRRNAELNEISSDQLILCSPEDFRERMRSQTLWVDVIISNLLANPLIELAESFIKWLPVKGKLALSGILKDQATEVCQAYAAAFELTPHVGEEWVFISGEKQK